MYRIKGGKEEESEVIIVDHSAGWVISWHVVYFGFKDPIVRSGDIMYIG